MPCKAMAHSQQVDNGAAGWEDDSDDEGLATLPPGEEGLLQSHAGGEAIFHQILKDVQLKYVWLLYFSRVVLILSQKTGRSTNANRSRPRKHQRMAQADSVPNTSLYHLEIKRHVHNKHCTSWGLGIVNIGYHRYVLPSWLRRHTDYL
jgi:hypothetical protein